MKAEPSRLIPRKPKKKVELLFVSTGVVMRDRPRTGSDGLRTILKTESLTQSFSALRCAFEQTDRRPIPAARRFT